MKRRNSIKRIQKMKSRKRLKKMKGGMNQGPGSITVVPGSTPTNQEIAGQEASKRQEQIEQNEEAARVLAAQLREPAATSGGNRGNGADQTNAPPLASGQSATAPVPSAAATNGAGGGNRGNGPDQLREPAATSGGNRGNGADQLREPAATSGGNRGNGSDQTNAPPLASGQSATTPVPSAAAEQISRSMKLMKLSKTLKKLTDCTDAKVDEDEKRQVLNLSIKIMDSASTAENITASASKIHEDLDSKPVVDNVEVVNLIGLLLKSKSENVDIINKFGGKNIDIDGVFDKLSQFTSTIIEHILKNKDTINNYETFKNYSTKKLGLEPIDIIKLLSLIKYKKSDKKIIVNDMEIGIFGYLSLKDMTTYSLLIKIEDNQTIYFTNRSESKRNARTKHILSIMSDIYEGIYREPFAQNMTDWIDNTIYSSYFDYFGKSKPRNETAMSYIRFLSLDNYNEEIEKFKAAVQPKINADREKKQSEEQVKKGKKKPSSVVPGAD